MIPHLDTISLRIDEQDQLVAVGSVGLYSAAARLPDYQSGTVTLTHTTLYYINDVNPATHSLLLPLSRVHESNYWAGFINSSAKVTLILSEEKPKTQLQAAYWTCQICDTRNPSSPTCALCGSPAPPSASPSVSSESSSDGIPCPVCTYLNQSGTERCEICNSLLPLQVTELRLSFRKGGASQFYTLLKRAMINKAWARRTPVSRSGTPSAGINSLLTSISTTSNNTSTTLSSALSDLDSLQFSANEMLQMARQFNNRLSSNSNLTSSSATEPEESTLIRASLAALPAPSSSTAAAAESDEEYLKQLAIILQGTPIARSGGLVSKQRPLLPVPELWAAWMRYRGVSLLPPSVLPVLLPSLPQYTHPPLRTRVLGGSTVIFAPEYSVEGFGMRLVELLKDRETPSSESESESPADQSEGQRAILGGGMTTYEIHTALSLSLATPAENEASKPTSPPPIPISTLSALILESEELGFVLRDDPSPSSLDPVSTTKGSKGDRKLPRVSQPGPGVRWWTNSIIDYRWDGEPDA